MLGAIIGDIAGSFREFTGEEKFPELGLLPLQKDIPDSNDITTFHERPIRYGVTDDSILTLANAHALVRMRYKPNPNWYTPSQYFEYYLREYVNKYDNPIGGFGSGFKKWAINAKSTPYNSCGNGAPMRVSSVAYAGFSEDQVLNLAFNSAIPTHNHPEGIKAAQTTALAIFLGNNGYSWKEIKHVLKSNYLDYEPISGYNHFDSVCPETMRLVWHCLDETNNFHDAVFKAVTIPYGDSDTLGAIVGAITEGIYGIPDDIKKTGIDFLKIEPDLFEVYNVFNESFRGN